MKSLIENSNASCLQVLTSLQTFQNVMEIFLSGLLYIWAMVGQCTLMVGHFADSADYTGLRSNRANVGCSSTAKSIRLAVCSSTSWLCSRVWQSQQFGQQVRFAQIQRSRQIKLTINPCSDSNAILPLLLRAGAPVQNNFRTQIYRTAWVPLVIKAGSRQTIEHEHRIYRHLANSDSVVRTFGAFQSPHLRKEGMLIMESGIPAEDL